MAGVAITSGGCRIQSLPAVLVFRLLGVNFENYVHFHVNTLMSNVKGLSTSYPIFLGLPKCISLHHQHNIMRQPIA